MDGRINGTVLAIFPSLRLLSSNQYSAFLSRTHTPGTNQSTMRRASIPRRR
jgi:hypothetical protein